MMADGNVLRFTDQQKYFASQIQELQMQRAERWRALDQTVGSIEFFTQNLIASLQNDDGVG